MVMTNIAISGSTGLIGKRLINYFSHEDFGILSLVRSDFDLMDEELSRKLLGCKIIINLAGSPVVQRWTSKNRWKIIESRVKTTGKLMKAIQLLPEKPELLINASAIGVYDSIHEHSEESLLFDKGFLGEVVQKWEAAALSGRGNVERLVLLRIGIVLSLQGGAIAQMKNIFRIGLGGYLGSGLQKMAFIHIEDLCRSIAFVIQKSTIQGPVNAVAPNNCTNREFSSSLARFYGWRHLFSIPGFVLKILYGKAAQTLLLGQNVVPQKLMANGFEYNFPDIDMAINSLRNE
jgi:uncharacterized protein